MNATAPVLGEKGLLPYKGAMTVKGSALLPPRNPKGGRPTQDVAEKLGEHILDVALNQFIALGADGTSMDEIAAAANVSKRTLYARFGSKAGLLRAAMKRGIGSRLDLIVDNIPEGDLEDQLFYLGRSMLDASLKADVVGMEALSYWLMKQPEIIAEGASVHVGLDAAKSRIETLLRPRLAEGADTSMDGLDIACFVLDALVTIPRTRILMRGDMRDTAEEKDAYLRRAVAIILRGLP